MSLVIDDPRTEALARELAAREGVTPAEAVARALADRLGPDRRAAAADRLRALRDEIAAANPQAAEPIPWEVMKRWAQDEPDENTAEPKP
jgi:hypothetical protein